MKNIALKIFIFTQILFCQDLFSGTDVDSPVATVFQEMCREFGQAVNHRDREYVARKLLPAERCAKLEAIVRHGLSAQIRGDKKLAADTKRQQLLYARSLNKAFEQEIAVKADAYSELLRMFGQHATSLAADLERALNAPAAAYEDLRIFKGAPSSPLDNVVDRIFRPVLQTNSGVACATLALRCPAAKAADIKAKQARIQYWREHPEAAERARSLLAEAAQIELDFFASAKTMHKIDLDDWRLTQAHVPFRVSPKLLNFVNQRIDNEWAMELLALAKIVPATILYSILKKIIYQDAVLIPRDWSRVEEVCSNLTSMIPGLPEHLKVRLNRSLELALGVGRAAATYAYSAEQSVETGIYSAASMAREATPDPVRQAVAPLGRACGAVAEAVGNARTRATAFFGRAAGPAKTGGEFIYNGVGWGLLLWDLYRCSIATPALLRALKNTQAALIRMKRLGSLMLELRECLPVELFPEATFIKEFCSMNKDPELKALLKKLNSSTFASTVSFRSFHGRIVQTHRMMTAQKGKFVDLFAAIGRVDVDLACARLLDEPSASGNQFCLPEIVEANKPILKIAGGWSALIDRDRNVKNGLALGQLDGQHFSGALLSGPNAAGKSVFERMVGITVVMAQGLGIAPADSLVLTPFAGFCTSMDLMDDPIKKLSLYQVELFKFEDFISMAKQAAARGEFVCVLVDELLRGTKHEYSAVLSLEALIELAGLDNVIFVVSSHNTIVIDNVLKETNNRVKQIYVEAILDSEGNYAGSTNKVLEGKSSVDSAFFVAEKILSADNQELIERAKARLARTKIK